MALRNSPSQQTFNLNPVYYEWYSSVAENTLNENGETYERIRWGDSEVKQGQCFDNDWLTISGTAYGTAIDMQGRTVTGYRLIANTDEPRLNLQGLASEVYYLSIGEEVHKINLR